MKKINLFVSTLVAIVLISSVALIAKGNKGHGKKGKCGNERPAMTQETADKLNQLKNEFDSQLSENDLNTLNALRQKVKSERLTIKSQISEIKKSDLEKDEKKTKVKELLESKKSNREEVKTKLKSIMENNKEIVESLANSLKELKQDKTHPKRRKRENDNNQLDKKGNHLARFILHDEFIATKHNFNEKVKNSNKLDFVVNEDLLTFNSPTESSNSTFTLYDLNGNRITNIASQNINVGENTINLNSLNTKLEKGRYFLIIENENGVSSGKFIYMK